MGMMQNERMDYMNSMNPESMNRYLNMSEMMGGSAEGRRNPQGSQGEKTSGTSPEDVIKQIQMLQLVEGSQKILVPQKYTLLGELFIKRDEIDNAIQALNKGI